MEDQHHHDSLKAEDEDEEEEDYMGDLSLFIPHEASPHPSKKSSHTHQPQPPSKKPKTLNWQQRRDLKQREEDDKTLANIQSAIPSSNIGFKMLKQMGYNPGSTLGKHGSGLAEPVGLDIRRSRAGIGRLDPVKEKLKREEIRQVMDKRKEEELKMEFEFKQKSQWRIRRVVVNYNKAKAALDQLEKKEIVEPEKKVDHEGAEQDDEEEEEEVITEEDLHEILMMLRDRHHYCLFCGCQYESMEALLSNCPGTDEDDH